MPEVPYYSLSGDPLITKPTIISGATSGEVVDILDLSYEYLTSMRHELIVEYGILWYEEILLNSIWQSKSIVSFSDFCEFPEIRQNFHLLFCPHGMSFPALSNQWFYKTFAQNNQNEELNNKLIGIFSKGSHFDERTLEDMRLLYQAYTIMISYDEVGSNHALFH